MSNRLDKDREAALQPVRINHAIEKITALGYVITYSSDTEIQFDFNGSRVYFFPYSGWHSGASIKDGRGLKKLLQQIQP